MEIMIFNYKDKLRNIDVEREIKLKQSMLDTLSRNGFVAITQMVNNDQDIEVYVVIDLMYKHSFNNTNISWSNVDNRYQKILDEFYTPYIKGELNKFISNLD